jgi:hypothetical protein
MGLSLICRFGKGRELELLGINMNKTILVSVCLIAFSEIAVAKVACNGKITSDIEACTKANFEEADQELNAQYRSIIKKWSTRTKTTCLKRKDIGFFIRLGIVTMPSIRRAQEKRRELINWLA